VVVSKRNSMEKRLSANGSCLCGAVTMTTNSSAQEFAACHCGRCRTWGGGPLLAVQCGSDVQIEGEESVTVFDAAEWAERGFCKTCGTHLFYRLKGSQEYHIPVGFFADSVDLKLTSQIFIDRKPANYSFAQNTKDFTEAEVFAMYAPKE
jgi:hypothetical protein